MALSTGDQVTVERTPFEPYYLQSIDLEVDFLRRGHEIAEVFSADEMTHNFVQAYTGVIFSVGQSLIFEFRGQNLKVVVKGLHVQELSQPGQGNPPKNAGVILKEANTDVTFMKNDNSRIKLKSSAKK